MEKISFKPGLNIVRTQLAAEGMWAEGNLVRFREGLPEVYGGWTALGTTALTGVPRGIHAWSTLAGIPTIAVGTNVRLYALQSTTITTPTNPFTTYNGSTFFSVTDAGAPNGLVPGSIIQISGASAVNGITPAGQYSVFQVITSTYYLVNGTVAATGAGAGGGTPTIQYLTAIPSLIDITPQIQGDGTTNPFTTTTSSNVVQVIDPGAPQGLAVGQKINVSGASAVGGITLSGYYSITGFGVTGGGVAYYTVQAATSASSSATGGGSPAIVYYVGGASSAGTTLAPNGPPAVMTWTLDNFGEQLIACSRNSAFSGVSIFVWKPATPTTIATALASQAPNQALAIFVSNGAEQVVALGGAPNLTGVFDPMLVSWCNIGDYTTWNAAATNSAGDYHLTDGSQLMWGGRAGQQNLIWSDTALYSMQFVGGELIYGFTQLGTNCGLIGPQAAGIINGVAFWMSRLNFMWYNGTVQVLDCPLRDLVFTNIFFGTSAQNTNLSQQGAKVICGINSQFGEARWDFPSAAGSGENDAYVIVNYSDPSNFIWTYGFNALSGSVIIARTAWTDVSAFGNPVAFDASGNGWTHESGYQAGSVPLPWFINGGDTDIEQGDQVGFLSQVILDQILTSTSGTPEVALVIQVSQFPDDVPAAYAFTITAATDYVWPYLRGRQISFGFSYLGTAPNTFWRLGAVRYRVAPDGFY